MRMRSSIRVPIINYTCNYNYYARANSACCRHEACCLRQLLDKLTGATIGIEAKQSTYWFEMYVHYLFVYVPLFLGGFRVQRSQSRHELWGSVQ